MAAVLPPHVEHHSHRTVVSHGAAESSTPTGIKPGAENWDLTVRAMTSCFAHLLLLQDVIDSVLQDNIAQAYMHTAHWLLATVQLRSRLE